MFRIAQIDLSKTREGLPMPPRTGGQHAIKHVNPARHRLQQILRRANPHEIAGPVLGQFRRRELNRLQHQLLAFAHRQSANGIAFKANIPKPRRTRVAKLFIHAPLHNAEISPARLFAKSLARPRRPTQRKLHGFFRLFIRVRIFNALIKLHLNIRTEQALNIHGALRRQFVASPINMRLERGPLLRDFPDFGKRHDLKAATVSKYRPAPTNEFVQAAKSCHLFRSGPQHQVIGVAQNDVSTRLLHLIKVKPLHCAHSSNRHESRCANIPMPCMHRA